LDINEYMLPCFYKKYFGFDCPGCGMQRSFLALINGDFTESFMLYPALIPIIMLFTFLALHIKFKFTFGAKALKLWFVFTCLIIMTSYVLKLTQNGLYS